MKKSLLVTTSLPTTDKSYKRFVESLNHEAVVQELWPGTWFVKSDESFHSIEERLDDFFGDDTQYYVIDPQYVITVVDKTFDDFGGMLNYTLWNFINNS